MAGENINAGKYLPFVCACVPAPAPALSERSGKCRHAGKEHYKRVAANSENEFWALERKREMVAR